MSMYNESVYHVFGINISARQAIKKDKVRACKHDTDVSKKFCGECGKPVFVEKKFLIADEINAGTKNVISVFCSDQEKFSEGAGEVVVGFCLNKQNQRKIKDFERLAFLTTAEIEAKKTELIKFLMFNCISFDEKNFGFYSVIESS
jgi:hypothetical protein